MPDTTSLQFAISVLVLLQLKHMLADFYFQTPLMLRAGATYLHIGRVLHVGLHVLGTWLAFAMLGAPTLGFAFLLGLLEGIAHYHIDWGKGAWSAYKGHSPQDSSYWRAFGFDQFFHQLTYLAMLWAIFNYW